MATTLCAYLGSSGRFDFCVSDERILADFATRISI
ncbi:hypothetical protein BMETH_149_2 [methanotrophic bacterial endosymbiont of Bathymodiolus sp.]|nr:hypothetical protein BMETH_149_2 [methanotrophic bacterial endosymbiont of Bathymodiolus sp.]